LHAPWVALCSGAGLRTLNVKLGEHDNKRKCGATKDRVPFKVGLLENIGYWDFISKILLTYFSNTIEMCRWSHECVHYFTPPLKLIPGELMAFGRYEVSAIRETHKKVKLLHWMDVRYAHM
jgi:hypothetical protein